MDTLFSSAFAKARLLLLLGLSAVLLVKESFVLLRVDPKVMSCICFLSGP